MIGLILSSILIILLVVKLQISDRICDDATIRILYSDEEYSTESEEVDFNNTFEKNDESSTKQSNRTNSKTFTKEFDRDDYSEVKTEQDAEELLKKIYAGGGKNK